MANNYTTIAGQCGSGSGQNTTESSSDALRRTQAQTAGRRGAIAGVLDGTPGSLNHVAGPGSSSSAGTHDKK
ncbi:uncharacterized protein PG986_005758 [Apiospora aurea]|uniref:SMP domain-containing protein n=1 Tax=Apiospora aurea TaxID=335848 RepID=A0ABR1QIH5_9PEZI